MKLYFLRGHQKGNESKKRRSIQFDIPTPDKKKADNPTNVSYHDLIV